MTARSDTRRPAWFRPAAIVCAGLTDDQFANLVLAPDYHAGTPQGKLCFHDPTGSQGMTVEQAEIADEQQTSVVPPPGPVTGGGSGGSVKGPG
ncbi:MAG: hypothetical protein LBI33_13430 [Propionibacteriaceae bacterium]|jgi:hypothetical protein|nr:hypothetical protein [Propionibacteriaceae bacterium]